MSIDTFELSGSSLLSALCPPTAAVALAGSAQSPQSSANTRRKIKFPAECFGIHLNQLHRNVGSISRERRYESSKNCKYQAKTCLARCLAFTAKNSHHQVSATLSLQREKKPMLCLSAVHPTPTLSAHPTVKSQTGAASRPSVAAGAEYS